MLLGALLYPLTGGDLLLTLVKRRIKFTDPQSVVCFNVHHHIALPSSNGNERLLSILLWSVIAAAFIGPGTITSCSMAGAVHGPALLWALSFSIFGCFVLQEAAARVTVVSGRTLAEAIAGRRNRFGRLFGVVLVSGAILVGCAAYEMGNILGAASGVALGGVLAPGAAVALIGVAAFALLWAGSGPTVARLMGVVVGLMGLAFFVTAAGLQPDPVALIRGALVPTLPAGSGLLVIGLIGTTIVPYNLFLGSGLAGGQRLGELRLGLAIAIGLGGLISMAVMVVGTAVEPPLDFPGLAAALTLSLGPWAPLCFAAGLLAAGFSSAVTAPLAAAITARGLFNRDDNPGWSQRGPRFRGVWIVVLAAGVVFAATGVRPVPAILLAQAANGVLLPVVAAYLFLTVNDPAVMGRDQLNGTTGNLAMILVLLIGILLGLVNVLRAGAKIVGQSPPGQTTVLLSSGVLAVVSIAALSVAAARRRAAD
jgi:manganese transport protein